MHFSHLYFSTGFSSRLAGWSPREKKPAQKNHWEFSRRWVTAVGSSSKTCLSRGFSTARAMLPLTWLQQMGVHARKGGAAQLCQLALWVWFSSAVMQGRAFFIAENWPFDALLQAFLCSVLIFTIRLLNLAWCLGLTALYETAIMWCKYCKRCSKTV